MGPEENEGPPRARLGSRSRGDAAGEPDRIRVGGTFLGLAYFDLPYHLIAMAAALRVLVDRELAGVAEKERLRSGDPSLPAVAPRRRFVK